MSETHSHTPSSSCCGSSGGKKKKFDYIMWGSIFLLALSPLVYIVDFPWPQANMFFSAMLDILGTIWWGIIMGLISVGLIDHIPREYFTKIMGRTNSLGGLAKACVAGLVLDVCSHGIVIVAGKLYERGLSLAQVMTFLIASPWNSLTVTFVLIALIGFGWTAVFIAASLLIAFVSGLIYWWLEKRGILPPNPHTQDIDDDLDIIADAKSRLKKFRPSFAFLKDTAKASWKDGKMVIRWILFGAVLAAAMRAFVPQEMFSDLVGPTFMGMLVTLVLATVIEVCSEGSAPIAAEIMQRAAAPGNGFTFLMAGVATDYTEIMVLREVTKSWRVALSVSLVTVPQVLLIGWLMNMAGG